MADDLTPGGGLAVPEGDRVVPVINCIAPAFGQVVLTQAGVHLIETSALGV